MMVLGSVSADILKKYIMRSKSFQKNKNQRFFFIKSLEFFIRRLISSNNKNPVISYFQPLFIKFSYQGIKLRGFGIQIIDLVNFQEKLKLSKTNNWF